MKTMPTAFLLTSLDDSLLVERAAEWGWTPARRAGKDIIFVTPADEVVRTTRSSSQASHLRRGTKIYLGPAYHACYGLEPLTDLIDSGFFTAATPPG